MRKRTIAFSAAFLVLALLVSPSHAQPAPAPDQARLYFYRGLAPYGTMIWTAVYLNGAHIGDSGPGSYFWRDVPPGTYTISLRSQGLYPDQFPTVTVSGGGTAFVRVTAINYFGLSAGGVGFGGGGSFMTGGIYSQPTFAAQIVAPDMARREMADLSAAN